LKAVPKNDFRAEPLLIMRPSFLKKSHQSGSKDGTMFSAAHIPSIVPKRSLQRTIAVCNRQSNPNALLPPVMSRR
jgi:hypothetical protein